MTDTFVITKYWLNKHKTKNGGWTKMQIAALGLCWPLSKGWQNIVIGKEVNPIQKENFEYYVDKPNKKQVREVLTIDNCIAYLFKNANKIHRYQMLSLHVEVKNKGIK